MTEGKILKKFNESTSNGLKSLSILIDPDKVSDQNELHALIDVCNITSVDNILVGGSLITSVKLEEAVRYIKTCTAIPVIIFPGSNTHIFATADGILFLSLISGRNPEFLIGQHVVAAPILKNATIEILPTGYILVGNSIETTVAYISNTLPIPREKYDIAACTAMAGEMLGLKLIYLDAGSGAASPVPGKMISTVKKLIDIPLIVGGGIDTVAKGEVALHAGADMLVVGNGVEKQQNLIREMAELVADFNDKVLNIH